MASFEYSVLLSELQKLSSSSRKFEDEEMRRNLADALRKGSMSIETPLEFVRRVLFTPLQIVTAKIGLDLGIFEMLDKEETISLEELVHKTGAEKALLSRLLRILASSGMISQHTTTTYAPTTITHALSEKGFQAGILHHFDVQVPVWFALPNFLASTSYSTPHSSTKTAFQMAHSTPLQAFQWGAERPQIMADFALWMTAQRAGEGSWLKVFTPEEILRAVNAKDDQKEKNQALFVDVGGGIGHQSYSLRSWLLPSEPNHGAIIFQDLPSVIALAKVDAEGVQAMVHDMYNPQPVQGAKFYYLRNILHDHPDSSCIAILQNIKLAMGAHSTILIDELVVAEKADGSGRDEWVTSLDIAVMASLGAKERTKVDWDELLAIVGVYIEEVRKYDCMGNSILIVKRK